MLLPIRSANPSPKTGAGVRAPGAGGPAAAAVRSSSISTRKPAAVQQLGVALARLDERRGRVLGPRQRIREVAVADAHLLVDREQTAGFEHTPDLGEHPVLRFDVHADVVQHRSIERPVVVWHLGRGTDVERHSVGEPDAFGDRSGDVDEVGAEVDARDPTTGACGSDACWSADAGTHVEQSVVGGDTEDLDQVLGGRDAAGVQLVDATEVLDS